MLRNTLPMRPRRLRRLLVLTAFVALIAGAGAGVARADAGADYAATNAAAICLTLDQFPTFAGIEGIATAIVQEGYLSFYDAGRAIRVSVDNVCPEHTGLINLFSNTYAPSTQPVQPGWVA